MLTLPLSFSLRLTLSRPYSCFHPHFLPVFRSPSWVLDRIAAIEPRKSTSLASADQSPSTSPQDKNNGNDIVKEEEQEKELEVEQEEQEIKDDSVLQGGGLEEQKQQQWQQQQAEELGSLS